MVHKPLTGLVIAEQVVFCSGRRFGTHIKVDLFTLDPGKVKGSPF